MSKNLIIPYAFSSFQCNSYPSDVSSEWIVVMLVSASEDETIHPAFSYLSAAPLEFIIRTLLMGVLLKGHSHKLDHIYANSI